MIGLLPRISLIALELKMVNGSWLIHTPKEMPNPEEEKKEIQNMVREADENREEDQKRRELVDARNNLDGLVFATEKLIKENGEYSAILQKWQLPLPSTANKL